MLLRMPDGGRTARCLALGQKEKKQDEVRLGAFLKVHRGAKTVAQRLPDIVTKRGTCRSVKRHFERFTIIKQDAGFQDYLPFT